MTDHQVNWFRCEKCNRPYLELDMADFCCLELPEQHSPMDILLEAIVDNCHNPEHDNCSFYTFTKHDDASVPECLYNKAEGGCFEVNKKYILKYAMDISKVKGSSDS